MSSVPVFGPLPHIFRQAVDVIEALEHAGPHPKVGWVERPSQRPNEALSAFCGVLNPTGLAFWNDIPRDGWLNRIEAARDLDRDTRAVLTALGVCVIDLNGALDHYPHWWNRQPSDRAAPFEYAASGRAGIPVNVVPLLGEVLVWEHVRQQWWVSVAGLWVVMSEAERKGVPARCVARLRAVTGWNAMPDTIPQALPRRGSRKVELDEWKSTACVPDAAVTSAVEALTRTKRAEGEKRKTSGRKPTDLKGDARIWNAWKTGTHADYAALARALGLNKKLVAAALERVRKRRGSKPEQ